MKSMTKQNKKRLIIGLIGIAVYFIVDHIFNLGATAWVIRSAMSLIGSTV
jgi:hypothetical protein